MEEKRAYVNAGTLGRVVRVVIGLAVLATVFVGPRTPLGWWGLLPLMTGLIGRCPTLGCAGGSCSTTPGERSQ